MFEQNLTQLGFSKEESQIYLSLIENGPQTATKLSETTSVGRTYVYAVTDSLTQKNLIEQRKVGKVTRFIALDPEKLAELTKSKQFELQQASQSLNDYLPQLKSKYVLTQEKPLISYYEGFEGIKTVFNDTLQATTPILAFVGSDQPDEKIWNWLRNSYVHKRVAKQIPVKVIVSTGEKLDEYLSKDQSELRETKTVSSEKYPVYSEINIYDETVVMMQYNQTDSILATKIQNKAIADSYRSWFNLTWDNLAD